MAAGLFGTLGAAFGFGKAVAEAADMPDDVDDARAIKHTAAQLGRLLRKLDKAGLSRGARIVAESEALGCRMALKRLGVPEGEIPRRAPPVVASR